MKLWPFGKQKRAVSLTSSCEALPVPTHLKPYFVAQQDKRNTTQITGEIRCTCGCTEFHAHHRRDSNGYYRLTCGACCSDVILFDERLHGWDTVVCHMQHEDEQSEEVTAICDKCGGGRFGVTVWIEHTEKSEFISCVEGELPESEWVNAFTWFAAHLTCTCCGCRQRGWADIETA